MARELPNIVAHLPPRQAPPPVVLPRSDYIYILQPQELLYSVDGERNVIEDTEEGEAGAAVAYIYQAVAYYKQFTRVYPADSTDEGAPAEKEEPPAYYKDSLEEKHIVGEKVTLVSPSILDEDTLYPCVLRGTYFEPIIFTSESKWGFGCTVKGKVVSVNAGDVRYHGISTMHLDAVELGLAVSPCWVVVKVPTYSKEATTGEIIVLSTEPESDYSTLYLPLVKCVSTVIKGEEGEPDKIIWEIAEICHRGDFNFYVPVR